jgi:hypothetical protein
MRQGINVLRPTPIVMVRRLFSLIFLLSFLLAYLSYQLIELPVRKSVYFLSRPGTFVSVAGLAMAVVVFSQIALRDRGQSNIGSPVLNKLNAARYDLPEVYLSGCDDWTRSSVIKRCEFGAKTAVQEVMLIGDSMSAQWFSTFAGMVDQAFVYQQIGQIFSNCERWRANVLAEVIRTKPDIVVMGSALGYPFSPAEWEEGTFRILAEIHVFFFRRH